MARTSNDQAAIEFGNKLVARLRRGDSMSPMDRTVAALLIACDEERAPKRKSRKKAKPA